MQESSVLSLCKRVCDERYNQGAQKCPEDLNFPIITHLTAHAEKQNNRISERENKHFQINYKIIHK